MASIIPCLWYARDAEAAAQFYASIFPNSRVDRVAVLPGGQGGSATVVSLTLCGREFTAFSASGADGFNHAVSFFLACDTQEELDRYWDALLEGGRAEQCGWLKDRYGLSWQIVPATLRDMVTDPDRAKAARVFSTLMTMVKLDIARLQAAFEASD